MTSLTPGRFSKAPRSTVPLLPVMPIAVRWAPGMGWACSPSVSITPTTRRTSSAVAAASITMSMRVLSLVAREFVSNAVRLRTEEASRS